MTNSEIFAKLVAISIVGGVAKSLFGPANVRPQTIRSAAAAAKDVVETVKS